MGLQTAFPVFLFVACVVGLAVVLLALGRLLNPRRPGRVKRMPYESGMDPVHDTRRRFDVRFHLLAIAFLLFDVELLFLYPWAVALPREAAASRMEPDIKPKAVVGAIQAPETSASARAGSGTQQIREPLLRPMFVGGMVFLALLALGFVYDWRKGVFQWR